MLEPRKFGVPQSLSSRLCLYYTLAFLLILSLVFIALYLSINAIINSRMDDDLLEDIQEMSAILQADGVKGIVAEIEGETAGKGYVEEFMHLYTKDGELVYASDDLHWEGLTIDSDKLGRQSINGNEPELLTLDLDTQEAETRVIYGAISPEYVLVIGESLEEREDIIEILLLSFAIVFLFAIPFAMVLLWYLARHAVGGIEAVSNAAREIKSGNLGYRINARNQVSEVQTLADTFDSMADRIRSLINNMREMTDNIAHDLRSPLGRIRLLSESALKPGTDLDEFKLTAENTILECDRLMHMINTSLDVAETEAGVARIDKNRLNVAEIVRDACELFEAVAEQKEIDMGCRIDSGCFIEGDTTSIQRMLANILDNAIKFTPAGQSVDVSLSCSEEQVEITIRDTGQGIESADLTNIFNRFYRVDQSRSNTGCGLGLSYARAVARAHGGNITVQSIPGISTEFLIILPTTHQSNPLDNQILAAI